MKAAHGSSRAAACAWLSKLPRFDPQVALLHAALGRAASEVRDQEDAGESAAMERDLKALGASLRKIRRRADRWCPFPALLESICALECSAAATAIGWGQSGYADMKATKRGQRGRDAVDAQTQRRARDLVSWLRRAANGEVTPTDAALTEIAFGWDDPTDDLAPRVKKWSKRMKALEPAKRRLKRCAA